jgi:hypothetical protein
MVPSIDGRIVTASWPVSRSMSAEYERAAASLDGDAWIIGRISMEPYAGNARLPASCARIPRTDFVAREDAPSYAIAIDPAGKLRWDSGSMDADHAVAVLTERVPDRYLAFLRARRLLPVRWPRSHRRAGRAPHAAPAATEEGLFGAAPPSNRSACRTLVTSRLSISNDRLPARAPRLRS